MTTLSLIGAVGVVALYLLSCVRILFEYERAIVFRLGRVLSRPRGPGLLMVFWPIERMVRVGLRTIVHDVPTQDIITHDNVSVQVNAVVYYRVVDPMRAILEVENFAVATSQLSQTTLRSVLGQAELDELLGEREKLNRRIQQAIEQHTDRWGIEVTLVEVKQLDLPDRMKRAMARQAESERERRAKVIHAQGELQAAASLRDAAATIQDQPLAMQMRFLQTLVEVGAENNSTIIFPVPIDLVAPLLEGRQAAVPASGPSPGRKIGAA